MKAFPMFIRTTGRRVVIVGGGEQAAQKARLLMKTNAHLVFIADKLDPELQEVVAEGQAQHCQTLSAQEFVGAAMAIIASGCPALDRAAHALAKAAHCQVNVVDQPELCDLTMPAIVDRDPIVVAIGSEGTAPVLTRSIKTEVERILPQNIGGLAAFAGRLRKEVASRFNSAERRLFWAWVYKGRARDTWVRGNERTASADIKAAIASRSLPTASLKGHVTVLDPGSAERDLLSLRAVERLQEADVIFYARETFKPLLELGRRDAERACLAGERSMRHTECDDDIKVVSRHARKGLKVVVISDSASFAQGIEQGHGDLFQTEFLTSGSVRSPVAWSQGTGTSGHLALVGSN